MMSMLLASTTTVWPAHQRTAPLMHHRAAPLMRAASDDSPLPIMPRDEVHFACPTCGADLLPVGSLTSLRCSNGHVVDRAKQGHYHLLPPVRADAAAQAQADEYARASRAFFDADGFEAQVDGVAAEVARALSLCPPEVASSGARVLNAGCGEGVWLRGVDAALEGHAELWGVDMGKTAVRYAAKRQPSARFAVASPHHLPFADGSFDCVVSVFAPAPWEEFCRVLRPGGAVIVARAGAEHLRELRRRAHGEDTAPRSPKEFSAGLAEKYLRLRTLETLRGEQARHLLAMTPFVRQAPPEARQRLEGAEELTTTVDMIVSTHRVWLGAAGGRFEL